MSQKDPRICIVGAGMSGMLMAIKLKKAGYTRFVIFEKATRVGGTWRENRYPGVACDVASFSYCYEFEPNPNWSRRFSPGPEIWKYLENVAVKYGLHDFIRFSTTVKKAEFKDNQWVVTSQNTTDGNTITETFDFMVAATGPLNKKKYPQIPGIDTFAGKKFHTADWDDEYDLTGKRIGVIGTGSSSVQSIGPLSELASHLTLFQRTAQWVIGSPNPYYSEFSKKLKNRFPVFGKITRKFYDWVGLQFGLAALSEGLRRRFVEWACRMTLNTVKDIELRKKLTPNHRAMCKRMIMSDTYYPALQKPHVELVVEGIDCIVPEGVKTRDGRVHPLDVMVLATGFYPNAWCIDEVLGLNGVNLAQEWDKGMRTYRSITLPGFPNYFMLIGPNSPITNLSLIDIADIGVDYVIQCVDKFKQGEFAAMTVKTDIAKAFHEKLKNSFGGTIWITGCDSWYLEGDGVPATWPWSPDNYRDALKMVDFADYDLVK